MKQIKYWRARKKIKQIKSKKKKIISFLNINL